MRLKQTSQLGARQEPDGSGGQVGARWNLGSGPDEEGQGVEARQGPGVGPDKGQICEPDGGPGTWARKREPEKRGQTGAGARWG